MIYSIDLLNDSQIKYINDICDISDYVNGKMAGELLSDKKNNLEMIGYEANNLRKYIVQILNSSEEFRNITASKKYSGIIFSKYETGMYYHSHNDDYYINDIRTDYSTTIFLNNPSEYEGGELVLSIGNQEIPYKLKAGSCLIYPTGLKHKVNPVLSGVRKVCVFWTESCIRDGEIRNLLSDYHIMWSKYALDILDKLGEDAYNDILSIKFKLMRKYGNFTGVINGN